MADPAALVQALSAVGPLAPLVYVFAVLLASAWPIPGAFSSSLLGGGLVFGPLRGFLLAWPAATAGACLAFAIGRRGGNRVRGRLPANVLNVVDALGDGGLPTLLLLRCTPLPVALSSYALGSIPAISASNHALATAAGFTRLSLHAFIGHELGVVGSLSGDDNGATRTERLASLGGAALLALSVGNIARLALQRRTAARRL